MLSFGAESFVFSLVRKNLKINIQNYNFAVVLNGYENWSLILKEERRLRVIGNRVLRRIFGSKKDEVTGDW